MKKVFSLFFALLLPFLLLGQNVRYDVEESVQNTEQKYKDACRHVGKVEMYVIQVMSLSGENSGSNAQERVSSLNSYLESNGIHAEAYSVFAEPNHKVKVGYFSTRYEAYSVLLKINHLYSGAFVTKDKVRISEIYEEKVD